MRPRRRGLVGLVAALLVAVLVAAAAAVGVAARNESKPDVYQASAVLLVDQEPLVSRARDNGILVKLTSLRIRFVDQLSTGTFTSALATQIGRQPGQLGATLVGVAPPSSLLVRVIATSKDKSLAVVVAQGAADKLVADLAAQQSALASGGDLSAAVTLTVVTPAERAVHVSPVRRDSLKQGGLAGGAVLLVELALLAAVRRRR